MFDKDNKFGFINNNENSNNNIEGLDNIKTDINNIKSDVDKLNTQYKDIVKKVENGNIGNNVEPELMDMPRIYFSEGTLPTSKTATVMKFDYYSKTNEYHGYVDIKCQGNSSMSYPKKNFTIKPYKDKAKTTKLKIDFKGWGKQSKFVLKANWIDLTHARNVVSARLWGDIIKTRSDYATALPELLRTSPNQGAIDGFPVLVYSNGVYQGRYTLNIPKDKWMSNMDDALDTHCILCGENYQSGCFRALPNINGSDWTDELHDVVPASIKTSWTNAIKFVMNSTDDEFKTNLSNYFDVNSLIDYLLYGIVSTNLDGFGKNQIYFTYDGVHWIASVYDLDSTWGLWWNGQSFVSTSYAREEFQDLKPEGGVTKQGNLLYLRLQQLFIPQLKARYTELRKEVLSASHIIQKFEEFNDVCPKDIVQEDYASTTGEGKFTGIPSKTTNNIQQLRSYINARLTYVDGYINALQEATPCTNITLNKTELTITGNSSTEIPSDENIDITKNTQKGFICRSGNHITGTLKYGDIRDSSQDITTDFIPCNSTNTFELTMPSSTYGAGIVAYDLNKDAIKVYTADNQWASFGTGGSVEIRVTALTISSIPENTAYIRICFNLTDLSNVVLTKKYGAGSATPTEETINTTWSSGALCRTSRAVSIKNTPFGDCFISDADITTDFIPSTSSSTFTVVTPKPISVGGGIGIVGYDSSKNAITVYEYRNNEYSWTNGISEDGTACTISGTNIPIQNIPDNVTYIKICINQSTSNNTTITKTTIASQEKLIATLTPANTTDTVIWSINPDGICTVEKGVVTPIKNGTCVITATCGTKTATCNVTVNLPSVACTSIALDKTALQLGTIEGAQPDTQTNYLEGFTWKDGQFNDYTGVMGTGTDKCITDIKLPATGLYTLSATVNYNYFKIFVYNSKGELIATNIANASTNTSSIYVYDLNCSISISLFPNSLSFDANNVSLKYVRSLASTSDKDIDIQANVIANPSLLATSGDYKIIELFADTVYNDVPALKLGSTIYKIITTITNLNANQADISITRMNNGYCTKGIYKNKTFFNIAVPSTWGTTKEDIANYIQTNNIAVVINPSEYLNSADIIGSTTINKYQLKPTVQPSNTTDTVVWSVSPEGIVTVNDGLVKAVSNGETVVTATCGNQSATCNVTVSGLTDISSINYELAEPLVCDGTSTYKDTGIQLLSSNNVDRDWTMLLKFTPAQLPTNGYNSIVHCMNEDSSYPGINIDINNGNRRVAVPNNNVIGKGSVVINNPIYYALIKQGKLFTLYDNIGTVLGSGEPTEGIIPVNQTLLLGAYQTVDGVKGRYFNGTINKFKLVEEIYTVPQIKQYFGIVENPIAYTLPEERIFNGTSDYVDTGIQLFKTDQNFTITMDVTADDLASGQHCIVHCMKEESPYPGITIQKDAGYNYALGKGNNTSMVGSVIPINQRTKVVIVKNGTTMKIYNSNNVVGESPYVFTSIDQTLLLGAYQTVEGTKGRFFKGTIHEFSISNTVYTQEQINTYLGITSQGRVFKIDSTCMNTTGNKLTDSIGGIEATLGGAPTVNNNQIMFTENDNFSFDISSLNLTRKNRTLRVKFTPTSLDDTSRCVCGIGKSGTVWNDLTSVYIQNSKLIMQHGGRSIGGSTVGATNSSDNRLPEAPSINTEYEIVITESLSDGRVRWFINGTLVQDGNTILHKPLVLCNIEGKNRFVGSYSLIEIYDVFCDTYDEFSNIANK